MQPALRVAEHHWHQPPKCQPVTIVWDPTLDYLGAASQSKCEILLDPGILEPQDKTTFCRVLTHEWGHLVLGPTYFAKTNPEEPDESPDWRNIMFAVIPERFAPCESRTPPGR